MQHRPLIIALTLSTLGVAGAMVFVYFQTLSDTAKLSFESPMEAEAPKREGRFSPLSWTSKFSGRETPAYLYPAPELHVKLDFPKDSLAALKTFRVVVGELDPYRFFCLNQVLLAHGIDYAYYKAGGDIRLIVTTKDEAYLRSVLKELQRYEITYELHQS